MTKLVYIENGENLVWEMFRSYGYKRVLSPDDAELIVFTGGPDVSPMLYGEFKHPRTFSAPERDERCYNIFMSCPDTPFVGICRGAQFLNVMAGGTLFQHVNGHINSNTGFHPAVDQSDGKVYHVTSDHHQMMIPPEDTPYDLILTAKESTRREYSFVNDTDQFKELPDIECIYYPDINSLCYQPHPEWVDTDHESQEHFFLLIEQYLF